MNDVELWRELGQQLRVDGIRPAAKAGSGHPTSAMSAADLMAVLMAKYLRYDFDNPHDPHNDRLVFSKGHVPVSDTKTRACHLRCGGVPSR